MKSRFVVPRRQILRGLGASVALPFLDAMAVDTTAGAMADEIPRRAAFLYVPNGVSMAHWRPSALGADFELPPTLQPLADFRDQLMVISGLTLDKARDHGDGGGDHARALSAFLTCCQARKTHGADIRAGISVDQIAAWKLGDLTRLPSLEIGCEAGNQVGNCDSGYSCAYSNNISWRTESTPQAKEVNPRVVFERLFLDESGDTARDRSKRLALKKSILDTVHSDARKLNQRLGAGDQRKMDEYLTSVRELEQRIERSEKFGSRKMTVPDYPVPTGIPDDYREHLQVMSDMLVLAFQTDTTRVSTFIFANEGSNRGYPMIEVSEGHHDLSHHQDDADKIAKLAKINLFHMERLAYLLNKMKSVTEGSGTLLENTMLVYGSGISDGNRHNHEDLPILLVGSGGGTIRSGRHVSYPTETPLANLYLSLLERLGIPTEKLGDSNGKLMDLS